MSAEENKAIVRRFYEAYPDIDAAFELIADALAYHGPGNATNTRERWKQGDTRMVAAMPDARVIVDDQIAEGDKVVTRWTLRGTSQNSLMGFPPTGKPVTITAVTIDRVAGSKIVEHWFESDVNSAMRQLGAVPTT